MNKHFLLLLVFSLCLSCTDQGTGAVETIDFFGKESVCFDLKNKACGYKISILETQNAYIWHFEKDSIDYYAAIHEIPNELHAELDKVRATDKSIRYLESNYILNQQDTLTGDFFFMDVNFDNVPEFVVSHPGYNRTYYVCFDFTDGQTSYPGFMEPMSKPPYNNLVSGEFPSIQDNSSANDEILDISGYSHHTEFNYKEKTIHIVESLGCCAWQETWAKLVKNEHTISEGEVKVIRKVYSETFGSDATGGVFNKQEIYEYDELNDSLKLKTTKTTKY